MGKIVWYKHYGQTVAVDGELKGKHKEHCLCYRCKKLVIGDRRKNCNLAEDNFANCQLHNVVLPVWECPKFEVKEKTKGDKR